VSIQSLSLPRVTDTKGPSRAILIVISSFALTFTGCGLNFAFGVYQELYESLGGPFQDANPAQIDLIGTLAVSLMTIGAPFASAWTKSYTPRSITICGALIFGLANVLTSFSVTLWQFIVTQGILIGCGTCLTYIPAVTIAPSWFEARRGLAMGIVLSGTGVGGAVWAPALRALNASIGFRNTLRLTGGLSFILIATSGLVLRWHPDLENRHRLERRPGQSRLLPPLTNWEIVHSRKFLAQATGAVFQAAAYYTPIYFISAYSRTLGYSAAAGANFIALSNLSSAIGKVLLGYVADRWGRLNILFLCTSFSAISALAFWLPSTVTEQSSTGKGLFAAFVIFYSITAGAYVSLFPTALAEIFGVQHFASVNGLLYMLRGLGSLVGTPVAGALIRKGASSVSYSRLAFESPSLLIGALLVSAAFCVLWVRVEAVQQSGWRWKM